MADGYIATYSYVKHSIRSAFHSKFDFNFVYIQLYGAFAATFGM